MSVIEKLNARHYKILDLTIRGLKPSEIASRLGMTKETVSRVLHAPQFQHELAIRRARFEERDDEEAINAENEAAKVIKEHAREAAETLCSLIDAEDTTIQFRAATDILDRAGVPKVTRQEGAKNQVAVVIINEDKANLIKKSLDLDQD